MFWWDVMRRNRWRLTTVALLAAVLFCGGAMLGAHDGTDGGREESGIIIPIPPFAVPLRGSLQERAPAELKRPTRAIPSNLPRPRSKAPSERAFG